MEGEKIKNLSRDLNDAQLKAVKYCDGPALVIAGAGSGKTRVLVNKIIHLINIGYNPSSIMALTFTNKAANEMRERIYHEIGVKSKGVIMGTFHSVFCRILRIHSEHIGYTENFSIYSTNDCKSRIKAIIKEMGLDDKQYNPSIIQKKISAAKNNLILPNMYMNNVDIQETDNRNSIPKTGRIYLKYFQSLRQNNSMDFDDLLLYTNILFRDNPDILNMWQDKVDYLLVDEYQDTNLCQYMISRKIVEQKNKIFVVGDDAQSIYSFRGANIENILNFQRSFPDAKIFKLEENYRSTKTIVKAANELIKYNKSQHPKEIFSNKHEGNPIDVYRAETPELEANRVMHVIENIHYTYKVDYKDFAVLYRKNSQSRVFEQVLRRNSIPFKIIGGISFFSYKEILDIMAYLRVIVNEKDDEAMLRIINYPKRNIGDNTVDKLKTIASNHDIPIFEVLKNESLLSDYGFSKSKMRDINKFVGLIKSIKEIEQSDNISLYDKVTEIIYTCGIYHELTKDNSDEGRQKQDNMNEFTSSVDTYMSSVSETDEIPTLSGFLSEISLYSDLQDTTADDSDKVTLMTIHSSKGLEFPYVFIVGVEENTFPSIMSKDSEKDIEEERRLMYVALTRAKEACYISYAKERFNFKNGRMEISKPSRFIGELPSNLIKTYSDIVLKEINGRSKRVQYEELNSYGKYFLSKSSYKPLKELLNKYDILPKEISHLNVGDRVRHQIFGDGEITDFTGNGNDLIAFVRFDSGNQKKLLLRFAKLTKL